MIEVQYIAIVLIGLTILTGYSTYISSAHKYPGTRSWLRGFLCFGASMLLLMAHHLFDDHRILFAISNIFISLGTWFHFAGFSAVLRVDNKKRKWRFFWIVVFATFISGMLLIAFNTVWIARITANILHVLLLCFVIAPLFQKREDISFGQWRTIIGCLFMLGALYLISTLGTIAAMLDIRFLGSLANPLQILGPIEWILAVFLLAMSENLLIAGLLSEESTRMLITSEDQRIQLSRANHELGQFQSQILKTLAELQELRDEEAASHVKTVASLTRETMVKLGYSSDYAGFVADASMLHDIGKVGIPDEILKKQGALTSQERSVMQGHALFGYRLLRESDVPFFQLAAKIAAEHHEQWDGNGYPQKKKNTEISIEARVVAISDAFDALTSKRSYKEAWSVEAAKKYIQDNSGKRFDPEIAEVFFTKA